MNDIFLAGTNIYLRVLLKEDIGNGYVAWLNDLSVCKYNSHHVFPYTEEKAIKYIDRVNNSSTDIVLAIVLKENNRHIGNISLQKINLVNRNAEFAILIGDKENWGKGYSKEAAILIFKHGFDYLNLHKIYCGTSQDNIAMQKLALFLAMKEEGRRREIQYKNGKYVDQIYYGVLKKEFNNKFGGFN